MDVITPFRNKLTWLAKIFLHVEIAGFIAVFIRLCEGAAAIIFQAAMSAGATEEQVASWFWALRVGMSATAILLSLYYKKPVVTVDPGQRC